MIARITLPVAFEWPGPPVDVFRSCDRYFTDFAVSAYKPTGGATAYVDPVNGDDNQSGAIDAPMRTVLAAAFRIGVTNVVCRGGYYYLSETLNHTLVNKSFSITAYQDERVVFGPHEPLKWNPVIGKPGLFSVFGSAAVDVFDAAYDDECGIPSKLVKRASAKEVLNNPGSYFIDGKTLYVQTIDARVPDRAVMPRAWIDKAAIRWSGGASPNSSLYLQNISLVCTARGIMCPLGLARFGTVVVNNLRIAGPVPGAICYDAIQVLGVNLISKNTIIRYSAKDGYNIHSNSNGTPWAVLINSRSFDVGGGGMISCNGETAHGGSRMLSIGSYHERTSGPVVCSMNAGTQHCAIGSIIMDCLGDGRLYGNLSFVATGLAKLWVIGGQDHGCDFSASVDGLAEIRYRDCEINSPMAQFNGLIEPF
ncbi:MAG: hypothetical protein ACAH95_12175 [Fimbriimonas sp.]